MKLVILALTLMSALVSASERVLIISPHGGLGNRLRSICNAIIISQQTGRKVYHTWIPLEVEHHTQHVKDAQLAGWKGYFKDSKDIPIATKKNVPLVDKCYSEWLPEHYWYKHQNIAQKIWCNNVDVSQVKENVDAITTCGSRDHTILIETSMPIKLSVSAGGLTQDEHKTKMSEIYAQYFKPQSYYINVLDQLQSVDICIAIRRGDFLQYFKEAQQSLVDVGVWINNITTSVNEGDSKSFVIFSDDVALRDGLRDIYTESYTPKFPNNRKGKPWDSSFLEFLYLATKCQHIYGTPSSSFSQQAALFGNVYYDPIPI